MLSVDPKSYRAPEKVSAGDAPVMVGQFLCFLVAVILLAAAHVQLYARPGLSATMLALFGVIYVTGSITLKRPSFVCPAIFLWTGTYFILCHAQGVAVRHFPVFSVIPVLCFLVVVRYLLHREFAAYALSILAATDLMMFALGILSVVIAFRDPQLENLTRAVTFAGFALGLYLVYAKSKNLIRLAAAILAAVIAFLFLCLTAIPVALIATGGGLLLMGMFRGRQTVPDLHAPFPGLSLLGVFLVGCGVWQADVSFAGVALVGFCILVMNIGDIRHLRSGLKEALPYYIVGGAATLAAPALGIGNEVAISGAFFMASLNFFGLHHALNIKATSGLQRMAALGVFCLGLIGMAVVTGMLLWQGLPPTGFNIAITAFYGFLFVLIERGSRSEEPPGKNAYVHVAGMFFTCSVLMSLWRFGPLAQSAQNLILAPIVFWIAGLASQVLVKNKILAANTFFRLNYTFALLTLTTAFCIPALTTPARLILCGFFALGYAGWWAMTRDTALAYPLVLLAAFTSYALVQLLNLGHLWGSICLATVGIAGLLGAWKWRHSEFNRTAGACVVAWFAFALASVATSIPSSTMNICVLAAWAAALVAASAAFRNWRGGFHTWLVIIGSLTAAAALGLAYRYQMLPAAIFATAIVAAGYAVPAASANWDTFIYPAGAFATVSWLLTTIQVAGVAAFPILGYLPVFVFLIGKRLTRRPVASQAFDLLFHANALLAVCLACVFGAAVEPLLSAGALLGFALLYARRVQQKKHGLNVFISGAILVLAYRFVLLHLLGPVPHYFYVSLSALPITAAAWWIGRRTRGQTHLYLYGLVVAITLATNLIVAIQGPTSDRTGVLLLNAGLYLLLLLLLRHNVFIYLSTLGLTLLTYTLLGDTETHFLAKMVVVLLPVQAALGLLVLFPFLRRHLERRAPFSFLVVRGANGSIVFVVLLLLATGLIAGWHSEEVTSNPLFCSSCHNMAEPYLTWQESAHRDFACVKCHIAPGMETLFRAKLKGMREVLQTVGGDVPPRAQAQVEDAACLRPGCHQVADLQPVRPSTMNIGQFSHSSHVGQDVRGLRLRCATCHAHTTHARHFEIDKSVCYTCHFAGHQAAETDTGRCLGCHDLPTESIEAFSHEEFYGTEPTASCAMCHSEITHGEAAVVSTACKACHLQPPDGSENTDLVHQAHVTTTKVNCYQCHSEITHATDAGIEFGTACVSCHGESFHREANLLYSGRAGAGVADEPSPMFAAGVSCSACHAHGGTPPATSTALRLAIGKACDACHGEDQIEVMDMCQEEIKEELIRTSTLISKVTARLKERKLPSETAAAAEALLRVAQTNYDLCVNDGSYGVHNEDYVAGLLDKARADLKRAERLARSAESR